MNHFFPLIYLPTMTQVVLYKQIRNARTFCSVLVFFVEPLTRLPIVLSLIRNETSVNWNGIHCTHDNYENAVILSAKKQLHFQ